MIYGDALPDYVSVSVDCDLDRKDFLSLGTVLQRGLEAARRHRFPDYALACDAAKTEHILRTRSQQYGGNMLQLPVPPHLTDEEALVDGIKRLLRERGLTWAPGALNAYKGVPERFYKP